MITREQFLKNTNEDELFSVVSSVLERIKEKREKDILKFMGGLESINDFSLLSGMYVAEHKILTTDKELGNAIRKTLKSWGIVNGN